MANYTNEERSKLKEILGQRESSNNYAAENRLGYVGKYQFGADRLADLGIMKKRPSGVSQKDFMNDDSNWLIKGGKQAFLNDKNLQEKIMDKHIDALAKSIDKDNTLSTDEVFGRVAASHLKGIGGMNQLLRGVDNKDANGVKASEYYNLGKNFRDFTSGEDPKKFLDNMATKNMNQMSNTDVQKDSKNFNFDTKSITDFFSSSTVKNMLGAAFAGSLMFNKSKSNPQTQSTSQVITQSSPSTSFQHTSSHTGTSFENHKDDKKNNLATQIIQEFQRSRINSVSNYVSSRQSQGQSVDKEVIQELKEGNKLLETFVKSTVDNQDTSIKHNTQSTPKVSQISGPSMFSQVKSELGNDISNPLFNFGMLGALLAPEIGNAVAMLFRTPSFVSELIKNFKNVVSKDIQALSEIIKPFQEFLSTKWTSFYEGIKDFVGKKWDDVVDIAKVFSENVKEKALSLYKDLSESLGTKISELRESFSKTISNIGTSIKDISSKVYQGISNKVSDIVDDVKNSETFKKVSETVSSTYDGVKEGTKSTWGKISDWFDETVDTVKNSDTYKTVSNAVDTSIDYVKNTDTYKTVAHYAGVIKDGVVEIGGKAFEISKDFLVNNIAQPILDFGGKAFENIQKGVSSFSQLAKNADYTGMLSTFLKFSPGGQVLKGLGWVFDKLMSIIPMDKITNGIKEGLSTVFKIPVNMLGKTLSFFMKRLPVIGLILSIPTSIGYLLKGNYTQAGLEMISGIAGLFPGIGTAISIAAGGANLAIDYSGYDSKQIDKELANIGSKISENVSSMIGSDEVENITDIDSSLNQTSSASVLNSNIDFSSVLQSTDNTINSIRKDTLYTNPGDILLQSAYTDQGSFFRNQNLSNLLSNKSISNNVLNAYNDIVIPLKSKYPDMYINSGFRYKDLNSKVGGKDASKHLLGNAFDLKFKDHSITEVMNSIALGEVPGLDVKNGYFLHEGTWLHAQNVKGPNTKLSVANYNKGTGHATEFVPTRSSGVSTVENTVISEGSHTYEANSDIAKLQEDVNNQRKILAELTGFQSAQNSVNTSLRDEFKY